MAIDRSRAVMLTEVPGLLPPDALGRRVCAATVLGWVRRGRAGIRLEAERDGRMVLTDPAALARFVTRVAAAENRPAPAEILARLQKGATPAAATAGVA